MMEKKQKARRLLRGNNITLIAENDHMIMWSVKGSAEFYQVSYDKDKDSYNCTCRNVRPVDCYHISAVKIKSKRDAFLKKREEIIKNGL